MLVLAVARSLKKLPVDVTVIDQNNVHLFQLMLYQVATAGPASSDILAPVRSIMRNQPNVEVFLAEVVDVDIHKQGIITKDGMNMPFDYLILSAEVSSNYFGHIFYLTDFENCIIAMSQYAWNYLTYQCGARIIHSKDNSVDRFI